MDSSLCQEIEQTFISITSQDPVGKAVLKAEECNRFVLGTDEGWETIEVAADEEGLIF